MSKQSRARNFLELPLVEFKRAMKVFTPERLKLGPALLAFDGTFLSIESAHVTAVMRASGEWPTSQALIDDLENPNLVDLLALERTLSRIELMGSARGGAACRSGSDGRRNPPSG